MIVQLSIGTDEATDGFHCLCKESNSGVRCLQMTGLMKPKTLPQHGEMYGDKKPCINIMSHMCASHSTELTNRINVLK